MNTKALRQKILDLAIHGKLVPQNPNDESAEVLLKKIREEKAEKIKKGELKADKKDSFIFVGSDKRHYEQFADGTVKDIEDEIPFVVPDGWAWCRLPEIRVIPLPDGTHQTPTYCDKENGVPFLSSKDVTSGKIDWSKIKYITKELHQELQKRIAPKKDDILLAKNGTTGVAAIVEDETIFDIYVTLAVIRPNQKIVYPEFLLNIINSPFCKNQFNEHLTGIGVPNLHLVDINKTFIPLPPLNEQRQITDKIGSYTVHIDELEKNKSDLQTAIKQAKSKILDLAIHGKLVPQDPNDEPAEVLLKRIATSDNRPYKKFDDDIPFSLPQNWEWCYLGDICKVSSAKRVLQQDWKDSGIPFYRAREIAQLSNNETVKEDLFITPELYDELKNKYGVPVTGDLMISAVGTIGKVYIVKESDCFYYKDASVICFSKKEKSIDSKYLKLCLESGFLQNQIYSQSTGTTVDTITINKAQEYLFPLPNIKEQKRIVSKIEELFSYLDTISSNLE